VFIFQASIVRPLSEAGKLKLAGDMAELEFTISQFMSEYGARTEEVGDEYKALRAFRPLLFLDSAHIRIIQIGLDSSLDWAFSATATGQITAITLHCL